ncbi:hypothetical protein SKAU_G00162250 [Synaphobranchus kaupii]|uniref:Uncharacterized protein n=1 Tax=Synaphobranchus kaupii TaxID=118154 RepID=A0A9Q1IZV9_SYNKA|nr:hypothetical protein SKAU_G00162250 [Synaphobranchus kaupii]
MLNVSLSLSLGWQAVREWQGTEGPWAPTPSFYRNAVIRLTVWAEHKSGPAANIPQSEVRDSLCLATATARSQPPASGGCDECEAKSRARADSPPVRRRDTWTERARRFPSITAEVYHRRRLDGSLSSGAGELLRTAKPSATTESICC